jgi:hypothetical protein
VDELSERMGVSPQAVKDWRANRWACRKIETLTNVLWGSYSCHDRDLLVQANALLQNPKDTFLYYSSVPTVQGFWDRLMEIAGLDRSDDINFDAESVLDAAWLVSQAYPEIPFDTALQYANESRAFINNMKYGEKADIKKDERHQGGIELWNAEIRQLFEKYSIVPSDCDLVVVGLGAGLEGVGIYDAFKSFVGTDISRTAIDKSAVSFPVAGHIKLTQCSAESLPEIAKNRDIYISLKTYQSSYFDIERAAAECSKTVKPGGLAIISIPRGYIVSDRRVYGLSRTVYDYQSAKESGPYKLPDKQYVFELMSRISVALSRRFFSEVRIETGEHEYYLFARKVHR